MLNIVVNVQFYIKYGGILIYLYPIWKSYVTHGLRCCVYAHIILHMVTHFCISSHYTHGMYVATAFVVFFAKCRMWCLVINQNEINLYYVQQFRYFVHTIFLYPCMVADLVLTLLLDVKKYLLNVQTIQNSQTASCFSHGYILVFMLYTIIKSRFIMHRPMYWLHVHFSLPSSTWLLWTSCAWLLI